MRSVLGTTVRTPSAKALEVEGVKHAHFWRDDGTGWRGVVSDSLTGQEYDVRQTSFGWIVNDDWGIDHFGLTLRHAILRARATNE